MAHHNTILSQLLKLLPRHEFERLANEQDGKRRADALSRWSQFVALAVGHLGSRTSLRDIEATLNSQSQHHFHLGSQAVSKSDLARANEHLDFRFFEQLFGSMYQRSVQSAPGHGYRFKYIRTHGEPGGTGAEATRQSDPFPWRVRPQQ